MMSHKEQRIVGIWVLLGLAVGLILTGEMSADLIRPWIGMIIGGAIGLGLIMRLRWLRGSGR